MVGSLSASVSGRAATRVSSTRRIDSLDVMADPGNAPVDIVDPDAVQAFAFTVWNYKQGEMVSLMIHLGDRLGIYAHLDGAGPVTAAELARRSGLHERWLLEWLRANAAARLLEYHDGDRFELTDVGALVLARADSPSFAASTCGEPRPFGFVDRLAEAFESGVGLSYDDLGAEAAHHVERMLGPMARALLVPVVIPMLEGVQAKLEAGCGRRRRRVRRRARVAAAGQGVSRVDVPRLRPLGRTHRRRRAERSPTGHHERRVSTSRATSRCRPTLVGLDPHVRLHPRHDPARQQRSRQSDQAIKDDGTWLVKDIRSAADFVDNLKNPMLAMMYWPARSRRACRRRCREEGGARPRHARLQSHGGRRDGRRGGLHAHHHSRRARPRQPLLRDPAVTLDQPLQPASARRAYMTVVDAGSLVTAKPAVL